PRWRAPPWKGRHRGRALLTGVLVLSYVASSAGVRAICLLPCSSCCLRPSWKEHLPLEARAGASQYVEAEASGRTARTRIGSRAAPNREGRVPGPPRRTGAAHGPDAPWWAPQEQWPQTACALVRAHRDIPSKPRQRIPYAGAEINRLYPGRSIAMSN